MTTHEKAGKIRICYNAAIMLCKKDLKLSRNPTARELARWCNDAVAPNGEPLFPQAVTREMAQEMLDNPAELFD